MHLRFILIRLFIILITATLYSCGGGGSAGVSNNVDAGSKLPTGTSYTIGGTVIGLSTGSQVVLKNNGIDTVLVGADGQFTFATPVSSSGSYSVTVATQPKNQFCSVVNDSSQTTTSNVSSVAVVCATTSQYAYATSDRDIFQYKIGKDGVLSSMSPATVTGNAFNFQPVFITVDPTGRYAYVADWGLDGIFQFTVGSDGALTPMSPPSIKTWNQIVSAFPVSVVVDPTGRYVYVANLIGQTISQFTIGANGALSSMNPARVDIGAQARSLTVDPTGRYLYIALSDQNTILQYSIGSTGSLTPLTPARVTTGSIPRSVVVDSSGKYVYVANVGDSTISQYIIMEGGFLAPMRNANVIAGNGPVDIAIDPTGSYAYVANAIDDSISQYSIDLHGQLTPMTSPTVIAGFTPRSISIDSTGKNVYVSNVNDNSIWQYMIGNDGALTPTSGIETGNKPISIISFGGAKALPKIVQPPITSEKYKVGGAISGLASGAQIVLQNSTGETLSLASNATFSFPTLVPYNGSYSVTISSQPQGQYCNLINNSGVAVWAHVSNITLLCANHSKFAYIGNAGDGTISQFRVDINGVLSPMTPPVVSGGTSISSVAVDPAVRYVYAINQSGVGLANGQLSVGAILQYAVGTNGALSLLSTTGVAAGSYPVSIAVDPSGKFAYVADSTNSSVLQYSVGSKGQLTPLANPSVATGGNPSSMAFSPNGKYAYVANSYGGTISQYSIGLDGNLLPMSTPSVVSGNGTTKIIVDPSGQHAYSMSRFGGVIYQYSVRADGSLMPKNTPYLELNIGADFMTMDPTGRYVYVVSNQVNSIFQYSITVGGMLSLLSPSFVSIDRAVLSLAADSTGRYVYQTYTDIAGVDRVLQYSIDTRGLLSPVTNLSISTGKHPSSCAIVN
jgi:6-phosphogluconolactonase (cycloisomerase 2 family)